MPTDQANVAQWARETQNSTPQEILDWAERTFGAQVAFASSLGLEDQVITDMLAKTAPSVPIFTLDTGRLFQETYDLIDATRARYGSALKVYFPDGAAVERYVAANGVNAFRNSVELRKECCAIRKIQPLRRALSGLRAWICGLRRQQSLTRAEIATVEWDGGNNLVKINPIPEWTEAQVWDYIRTQNVPFNPLHEKGFPSIGCACCTRAIAPSEDIRAGRWWWESPEKKECGLHWHDGKPQRKGL